MSKSTCIRLKNKIKILYSLLIIKAVSEEDRMSMIPIMNPYHNYLSLDCERKNG